MIKLTGKSGILLTLIGYLVFRLLTWILIHSSVRDPLAHWSLWIPRLILWAGLGILLISFIRRAAIFDGMAAARTPSDFDRNLEVYQVTTGSTVKAAIPALKILAIGGLKLLGLLGLAIGRIAVHAATERVEYKDDEWEAMPLVYTEKGIEHDSPEIHLKADASA